MSPNLTIAPLITSVIVLDLDDTLYLERDYAASGFRAVGRWLEKDRGLAGFAGIAQRLFDTGQRGDIFDAGIAELGLAPTPELIGELVSVYRHHTPEIALQPDAEAFIVRTRPPRALALLTDGFLVAQIAKIRALGLEARLAGPIVPTDRWGRGYWKPHARGFELIQGHYGLPSSAFVYVADNPSKDFVAPAALGWRTIQIVREGCIHARGAAVATPAEHVITSLDALDDALLDALLCRAEARAVAG